MADYEKIGYSDYGDIYLKRDGDRIMLKRFTAIDYGYMEDYINDNHDIRGEWQDAVYNGDTEMGFDERREDYSYPYEDYFCYDSDADEYYDDGSDDTTRDYFYTDNYSKETVIENVLNTFEENYNYGNFVRADINERGFRELIGQYYDMCRTCAKEREEARKPHWNVFNYYK